MYNNNKNKKSVYKDNRNSFVRKHEKNHTEDDNNNDFNEGGNDLIVGRNPVLVITSYSIHYTKLYEKSGCEIINATTGATEKIGKLYNICGKKQEEIESAGAGDIAVASKLSVNTNDTICDLSRVVELERIEYPSPCYKMAVKAKNQGDESKISQGIQKLVDEDKTLSYLMDDVTHEQILSGLGELHLIIAKARLKNDFGTDIELDVPQIPYKETIRKKVRVQGRHKKQSGGHGQYRITSYNVCYTKLLRLLNYPNLRFSLNSSNHTYYRNV